MSRSILPIEQGGTGASSLAALQNVLGLGTQSASSFFASPSGSAGTPVFRNILSTDLPNSGVTPGSYTNSNITVDAKGRVTLAANGTAGVGSSSISRTFLFMGS